MNDWIPVSERLPEPGREVLICQGDTVISAIYLPTVLRRPIWLQGGYYAYTAVTHWMPLPEPPAKEGETCA